MPNPLTAEQRLQIQLAQIGPKPDEGSAQSEKKRYSEQVSAFMAAAVAEELRQRGLDETRPGGPGAIGGSGAERRLAGGIGAKRVDVSWSTEESGLLVGISIKSINFRDKKTNNFQKNLVNRRGDMLFEAVTLHRRFPYAVLVGLLVLDQDAQTDGTPRRECTLANARSRLALFTGRDDPAGRDEQFELFYIMLLGPPHDAPTLHFFRVGQTLEPITFDAMIDEIVQTVARRNPDFYVVKDGKITRAK